MKCLYVAKMVVSDIQDVDCPDPVRRCSSCSGKSVV